MSQIDPSVTPGGLIKSSVILDILTRLAKLESTTTTTTGAPTITGIGPSPVHIGDTVEVTGANFGQAGSGISVTIDGQAVPQVVVASSTQLTLTIPNVQNITAGGRSVILTVSNAIGFAAPFSFQLLPFVVTIPTGSLTVALTGSPTDATLTAGQSYNFTFTINAITTLDDTYTLAPSVDLGWSALVVDASNHPIVPAEVFIPQGSPPAGSTQTVVVRVTIPAGTTDGTTGKLQLAVTSMQNPGGVKKTSGVNNIPSGGAPPPAQNNIITTITNVQVGGSLLANGTLSIKATGVPALLSCKCAVKNQGTYQIATPVFQGDPGGLWSARVSGASQYPSDPVTNSFLFGLLVTAQPGAQPATMQVTVSLAGSTTMVGVLSQPVQGG